MDHADTCGDRVRRPAEVLGFAIEKDSTLVGLIDAITPGNRFQIPSNSTANTKPPRCADAEAFDARAVTSNK